MAKASSDLGISSAELARAARILAIRSRREASGIFAGTYASAFRGGGMEFDESRPYVPGDDVRHLDWNAMARSGEPFVKRFREERDQTLLLALDVSASMRFSAGGRAKSALAAHATALLAAAAGRTGDRVGLLCFDRRVRSEIRPDRGAAHVWRVIGSAVEASRAAGGKTSLAHAVEALLGRTRRRAAVVILSDFRDPALRQGTQAGMGDPGAAGRWLALGNKHDLVSIVIEDPREIELPSVGLVRLRDAEHPTETVLLDTGRQRVRAAYRGAAERRRHELERALRAAGSDVLWLRSDRDPLQALARFLRERAARSRVAA